MVYTLTQTVYIELEMIHHVNTPCYRLPININIDISAK